MSSSGDLKFALVLTATGGEQVRAELSKVGTEAAQSTAKLEAMGTAGAASAQKLGTAGKQASDGLAAVGITAKSTADAISALDAKLAKIDPDLAGKVSSARLASLGSAAEAASLSVGKIGAASVKAANDATTLGASSAKIIPINSAAQSAAKALDDLGAKGQQSASDLSTGFSAAQSIVTKFGLAVSASSAAAAGLKFGGETASFDKQIALVSTLTEDTPAKLKGLGQEIRQVSADLGVSAQTSAKAVYDIVSSGVNLSQSVNVLSRATKASIAGVTDVQTAAQVGVSVLNAYGLGVDRLSHVYDILFQTVNKGVITFPELASQLGDVLPVARAAGVSLEEVGAGMASLTLAGIKAPQAVTALRQAILQLSAPGPEAGKALDALGIKWTGLESTLLQISQKNLGIAAIRQIVPDVEAANGILVMSQNYERLHRILGDIQNSSGAFEDAFQKLQNTDSAKIDRFNASLENLKLSMGGVVLSATPLIESLTNVVSMLHRMGSETFGDGLNTPLQRAKAHAKDLEEQYNTGLNLQKMGPIGRWMAPNSDMAQLQAQKLAADELVKRLSGGNRIQDNNSPITVKAAGAAVEKPYDYQGGTKTPYDPLFHQYEQQYKLPDGLLRAVAKTESGFDPLAVSGKGAQGLMQLMPATAKGLGVANPNDPAQAIAGAAKLLAELLQQFNGDLVKALAAYNAGPAAVNRAGGNLARMPAETQKYVPEVAKNLSQYGHLQWDAAGELAGQKKLLDAQSAAQKAAIDLQDKSVQDGLKRQENDLRASLDARKITEAEYYAQLAIVRNKSIDAEIQSRRDQAALIRQQAGQDSADAAAQVAAKSQIARIEQEITQLEAQRTAVMDEARAALTKNAQALVDQYDKIGSAQRLLTQQAQILKAALAQDLITPEQYNRATQMITASQKAANSFQGPTSALEQRFGRGGIHGGDSGIQDETQVITGLGQEAEKTKAIAQQLGLTFTSAFENAIRSGSQFKDVLKGLASDLVGIFTRLAVTNPLMNALSGATGEKAAPTLGGMVTDTASKAVGSVISSVIGSFFADGGSPPVGKTSIVGERGPELFVPKVPGYVIPNHVIQATGGVSATLAALDDPYKRQFLMTGKVPPKIGGYFADGGSPPVGSPSVVGERGPEIFRPFAPPAVRGAINQFNGQAPAINQHFDFSQTGASNGGIDPAVVEARIRQATAEGAKQGYAMMLDDLRRNGPGRRLLK